MANVKPTQKQLEFMDWEFGFFFHYGIRTFYEDHTDWDEKPMDPARFAPTAQDCGQWIKTARAAGATYAVMTAKHHDGFALWQTDTTAFGVKESAYRNGRGDVVREFTDACRAQGLKVGLYYSPAQFGSRAMDGKAYDDYFIAQITELLTGYGKIDYLWFDGCGSDGHSFDKARIAKAIRTLQPEILLFNMWDPDTRWVGNEEGYAHGDDVYTVLHRPDDVTHEPRFLPYECDCKFHPAAWFYTDAAATYARSEKNLMGLYDLSVGRGGNLLLNVAPDRRGLLPEADAKTLAAFGEALRNSFASPVYEKEALRGESFDCFSDTNRDVSCLVLREDLRDGAYGGDYRLYYVSGGDETLLCAGTAVGHKRILRFPAVQIGKFGFLRLRFTKEIVLRDLKLFA